MGFGSSAEANFKKIVAEKKAAMASKMSKATAKSIERHKNKESKTEKFKKKEAWKNAKNDPWIQKHLAAWKR